MRVMGASWAGNTEPEKSTREPERGVLSETFRPTLIRTSTSRAGLVTFGAVLRYLREVANTRLSMTMVYYIRKAVYDKLQRLSFRFFDANNTSSIITRVTKPSVVISACGKSISTTRCAPSGFVCSTASSFFVPP